MKRNLAILLAIVLCTAACGKEPEVLDTTPSTMTEVSNEESDAVIIREEESSSEEVADILEESGLSNLDITDEISIEEEDRKPTKESGFDIEKAKNCEHEYDDITDVSKLKDACTKGVERTFKCVHCGHIRVNTDPVTDHVWSTSKSIGASCLGGGYDEQRCATCGTTRRVNETPATGHKEEIEVTQEATCLIKGILTKKCSVCHEILGFEEVDAIGHDWKVEKSTTPCKKGAKDVSTCKNCGDTRTEAVTAEHKWGDWTIEKEATCTSQGLRTAKCTVCKEEKSEKIEIKEHKWSLQSTTFAGCSTDGAKVYKCNNCGDTKTEVSKATGHTASGWVTKTAATCTTAGLRNKLCSNCGVVLFSEIISPTGHTMEFEEGQDPTCTEDGFELFECKHCDYFEVYDLDAFGHEYQDGSCIYCGRSR